MVSDFHTHSLASDGVLSGIELLRRAQVKQYVNIAITDHVGAGALERVIFEVAKDCILAREHYSLNAIVGVELTHVPPSAINDLAREAKALGAQLVLVHGETIVEPVAAGTNRAAVDSPYVDILAHPGLITLDDARVAAQNGVFLEISARRGHSLSNGHVAKVAYETGARLLLGSDAHGPGDLLSDAYADLVAFSAGIDEAGVRKLRDENPNLLLERIG